MLTNHLLYLTKFLPPALFLLILTTGCGDPTRAKVTGTVTIDGKPISGGMIEFRPEAQDGPTAGVGIGPDGTYKTETATGRMVVVIEGTKVVGQRKAYDTPDSPMIDVVKSYIPARYNRKSELRVDLKAGTNVCDFDLKMDP